LKIIGQKLLHGIPSFNLRAVLINVVNIVGIEPGERFCVSLVVSLFVFSGMVISCFIYLATAIDSFLRQSAAEPVRERQTRRLPEPARTLSGPILLVSFEFI
jgi:hypothetical protein